MMGATALELGKVVFDVLCISSLRAVALILPVWLALSLIRPRRPALEHGVWTAALCGMLLLPVLGILGRLPEISSSVIVETTVSVPAVPARSDTAVSPLTTDSGSSVDWRGLAGLLSLLVTSILLLRSMTARRRIIQLIARADAIVEPVAQELLQSLLKVSQAQPRTQTCVEPGDRDTGGVRIHPAYHHPARDMEGVGQEETARGAVARTHAHCSPGRMDSGGGGVE